MCWGPVYTLYTLARRGHATCIRLRRGSNWLSLARCKAALRAPVVSAPPVAESRSMVPVRATRMRHSTHSTPAARTCDGGLDWIDALSRATCPSADAAPRKASAVPPRRFYRASGRAASQGCLHARAVCMCACVHVCDGTPSGACLLVYMYSGTPRNSRLPVTTMIVTSKGRLLVGRANHLPHSPVAHSFTSMPFPTALPCPFPCPSVCAPQRAWPAALRIPNIGRR